jgi:hypothetical protein
MAVAAGLRVRAPAPLPEGLGSKCQARAKEFGQIFPDLVGCCAPRRL